MYDIRNLVHSTGEKCLLTMFTYAQGASCLNYFHIVIIISDTNMKIFHRKGFYNYFL